MAMREVEEDAEVRGLGLRGALRGFGLEEEKKPPRAVDSRSVLLLTWM